MLASSLVQTALQDQGGSMSSTHRIALGAALAMTLTGVALAQKVGIKAYPTVDRVEFVLECMQKNGGKQEFLYKCACVIDEVAQKYAYDDFVEASTAARKIAAAQHGWFRD